MNKILEILHDIYVKRKHSHAIYFPNRLFTGKRYYSVLSDNSLCKLRRNKRKNQKFQTEISHQQSVAGQRHKLKNLYYSFKYSFTSWHKNFRFIGTFNQLCMCKARHGLHLCLSGGGGISNESVIRGWLHVFRLQCRLVQAYQMAASECNKYVTASTWVNTINEYWMLKKYSTWINDIIAVLERYSLRNSSSFKLR